ncbi:type I-PGING CRISPR-associated protein Cas8c/Csp2 [Proteiniphilum sp. X52]|uniref:type I-PGING CRISPR-associated protein Cas8c/Csp2 n=1 Tax=Proteiniphilum sp. X52 TaxID=2382159 RepID=UPI000F09F2EE|nr:type I-PGING CRISPR-associated protein Cas8c/Csp2 [Proteiniphilum sp. X52]RNC64141.1 type I-PGING CRISPR-associated protein Cas8c/Csp2 [Proteiniphilum sp. X52]
MNKHPYIRYAQALLMVENELSSINEITLDHIKAEIEKGLNSFRVHPSESIEGKTKVQYVFDKIEKGDTKKGVFLSPNTISSDKQAKNLWGAANKYLSEIDNSNCGDLSKYTDIGMSEVPISGEFLSFSDKGNIGRGKPKASIKEQGFGIVSTLTPLKPCLQYRIGKKGQPEMFNVCIIPDLPIDKMMDFIRVFKQIRIQKLEGELLVGNVVIQVDKQGEIKDISPKRPLIYNGNFPNPPKSSALGNISLLGAIGEFAKQSEVSDRALSVLEGLKSATMYMIKYGGATTFTYNHHIVNMAKEAKLKTVVDSLYYSKLYNQDTRTSINTEYQKFDLFTSRFLQLFTQPAFKDFLSFRAEYPEPVQLLLNLYFIKMEKIDPKIVASARQLGRWLNLVAYFAAKSEIKDGANNYWGELRKVKAKVLVEMESSAFAAKTGDGLVAQVITRAGRLSGMDAPESASLFMEKTMSGELPLDCAKNLLIAFSRLRNKKQKEEQPSNITAEYGEDDSEDLSEE